MENLTIAKPQLHLSGLSSLLIMTVPNAVVGIHTVTRAGTVAPNSRCIELFAFLFHQLIVCAYLTQCHGIQRLLLTYLLDRCLMTYLMLSMLLPQLSSSTMPLRRLRVIRPHCLAYTANLLVLYCLSYELYSTHPLTLSLLRRRLFRLSPSLRHHRCL